MHTSYRNEITLAAPEDEVVRAVQGMITDPARIHPSDPGHPEVCPIFAYHEALQPATAGPVAEACQRGEIGCVSHKDSVARMLVERLEPFRRFHAQMAGHEDDVWDILQRGSLRARAVAQATLGDVRVRMGLTDLMAPEAMPLPRWEGLDLSGKVCC
jgi:tryptophanyl-tRNA synthetase